MLVVVDGPDGCGKTTISKELARHFGFAYIHFPYYQNETGQKILEMLNGKIPWDSLSFQCLQTCNRIQTISLLKEMEKENLGVIIDRYNPSTEVYGQLDGLDKQLLRTLCSVLPEADLEIIIDAEKPYRLSGDVYEQIEKWNRTKELYIQYALEKPSRLCLVTFNNRTIAECIEECKSQINEFMKTPPPIVCGFDLCNDGWKSVGLKKTI